MERKAGFKPNQITDIAVKKVWWKRRKQQSIPELRQHINILEQKKCGEVKKKKKYKAMQYKYRVKKKGLNVVLKKLEQRLQVKATVIKRYDQRVEKYRIIKLFQQDQKRAHQQLNGKVSSSKSSRF